MLDSLDAAGGRRWCAAGMGTTRICRHEIDELTVCSAAAADAKRVLTLASTWQTLAAKPDDDGEIAGLGRVRILRRHVAKVRPLVEFHAHEGGRRHSPMLVGVE